MTVATGLFQYKKTIILSNENYQVYLNSWSYVTHEYFFSLQKEMFASKVDMGGGGGGGNVGVTGSNADFSRERKLSNTSSSTGSMKTKWVKAFKSIKGGKETPVEPP